MQSVPRIALCVITILGAFSAVSRADLIYSNFAAPVGCPVASTASYNCGSGESLAQSLAFQFQAPALDPADEVLSEVDFAASTDDSTPANASVTASLYSDAGGQPGSALASSAPFSPLAVFGSDGAELFWTPGASGPALTPGDFYWIVLSATDSTGDVVWNDNTDGLSGLSQLVGSTWTSTNGTLGALQILGTTPVGPVPEPGTILMMSMGLAVFVLCYLPRSLKRRLASGGSACD